MPAASPKSELQKRLDEQREKNRRSSTPASTPVQERKEEKNYDLENNTFAKIIFSDASPEEKKERIAKALVYDVTQDKDQNAARQKEFELFKEYLQSERQRMAQDIIDLTDTDAFAEMHSMFAEMNGAIMEFDQSMKPLMDIIDAVYTLRMQGKEMTLDVFKEIKADEEAVKKREQEVAEKTTALEKLRELERQAQNEKIHLAEDKKFFGTFGPIKPDAKAKIAEIEQASQERLAEIASQEKALADLKASPVSESKFKEFATQKEKLRELLDISAPEHVERQKRLIQAAQNFINTTSVRGGRVLEHFGQLDEHIGTLSDANVGIQSIYAILTEASTQAAALNKAERDKLAIPPANESKIQEMQRTGKKSAIEIFISAADASAGDTQKAYADLTTQSFRIEAMRTANAEQISQARQLTSTGVAGVAEGLSSVLTSVNAAALSEAAALAKNSVDLINKRTDFITQQEALRQADALGDHAGELLAAVETLKAYADTSKVVIETQTENLQLVKKAGEGVKEKIEELRESVKKQTGVQADIGMQLPDDNTTAGSFNQAAANDDNAKGKAAKPAAPKPSKVAELGKKMGG